MSAPVSGLRIDLGSALVFNGYALNSGIVYAPQ